MEFARSFASANMVLASSLAALMVALASASAEAEMSLRVGLTSFFHLKSDSQDVILDSDNSAHRNSGSAPRITMDSGRAVKIRAGPNLEPSSASIPTAALPMLPCE